MHTVRASAIIGIDIKSADCVGTVPSGSIGDAVDHQQHRNMNSLKLYRVQVPI